MNGFKQRTLNKKKDIIEAARLLFFKQGPAKTSIAEIAKMAHVSQVSIYNYFESKDNLLEIIITEHLENSLQKAEEILDLDIPFNEKINKFFSLENRSKISDETLSNFNWENPKIQKIYYTFSEKRQIPFLKRFIEIGKREGFIEKDLLLDAILAYFSANMMIYQDKDLLKKGKKYIESLSHLFFYGLLGK